MSDAPDPRLDRARRQGRGHRPGARHGRRAEGRQRPPRHRDEPGAGGVPALPEGDAARPRRPALARAATGSSCRAATRRSRSTSSSSSAAWGWSSRTSRRCAPGAARPRATRSTATPPASRPPPARSARASATPWAWRWPPAAMRGLLDPGATGASPFDHHVYAICSDGDIEEGVSGEASSIAGVQQLGNLTLIYDANQISIEDDTDIALSRGRRGALRGVRLARAGRRLDQRRHGVPRGRPRAVRRDQGRRGGHRQARASSGSARSSPGRRRTPRTPGRRTAPRSATRRWPPPRRCSASTPTQTFEVARRGHRAHPDGWSSAEQGRAGRLGRGVRRRGRPTPGTAKALCDRMQTRTLPDGLGRRLPTFDADAKGMATRKASGKVINAIAPVMPELWGGSADLAESNNTTIEDAAVVPAAWTARPKMWQGDPYPGRVLHFGIREHGMGAIMNGIAAARRHPGLRRHLPHLLRLHARLGAAGRADGAAGHLRLDPRLHRPRRGRPDPPADRAPRRAPGHPRARRRPPGRRQRDGRVLAARSSSTPTGRRRWS